MEESSLIVKGVYSRDHRVKLFKPLVLPKPRKVEPVRQIEEESPVAPNMSPQVVSPDSLDREEEVDFPELSQCEPTSWMNTVRS